MSLNFTSPHLRLLSIFRGKTASSYIQTRNVNLLHAALSKARIGLHKIIPYAPLERLEGLERPAKDVSSKAPLRHPEHGQVEYRDFQACVKPGLALCRDEPESIEDKHFKFYTLEKLKDCRVQYGKKKISMKGRKSKQIHFSTTMAPSLFKKRMADMYTFMLMKYPVEVHVKATSRKMWSTIRWTLKNQLHLDPDIILKAMPEGSFYNIKPRTNGEEYCWCMSTPDGPYGLETKTFEEKRQDLILAHNAGVEPELREDKKEEKREQKRIRREKEKAARLANQAHQKMVREEKAARRRQMEEDPYGDHLSEREVHSELMPEYKAKRTEERMKRRGTWDLPRTLEEMEELRERAAEKSQAVAGESTEGNPGVVRLIGGRPRAKKMRPRWVDGRRTGNIRDIV